MLERRGKLDDAAHLQVDQELEVVVDAVEVVVDHQPVEQRDQGQGVFEFVDVEEEDDLYDDQRVLVDALGFSGRARVAGSLLFFS